MDSELGELIPRMTDQLRHRRPPSFSVIRMLLAVLIFGFAMGAIAFLQGPYRDALTMTLAIVSALGYGGITLWWRPGLIISIGWTVSGLFCGWIVGHVVSIWLVGSDPGRIRGSFETADLVYSYVGAMIGALAGWSMGVAYELAAKRYGLKMRSPYEIWVLMAVIALVLAIASPFCISARE
jgi:hypothetical protein